MLLLTRLLMIRSLRARPLRTLLSGFGIVLGVASMLAIGITNLTALDSVTRLFKDTSGKANLIVINSDSSRQGFSENLLKRVSNQAGIDWAVPSLHVTTVLVDDASASELGLSMFGASMGGLMIYGIDPKTDWMTRDYRLVAGRFLVDQDSLEVVLVQTFAEEKEIELGDRIEMITPLGIQKLKVVGLIAKEGPGQLNNGAFGVIPIKTAQDIFQRYSNLDQIDLVVQAGYQDSQRLEALKENLQQMLGKDYSVVYPASQGKRMTQMLGSYQIGLNFLSGIALFVGAFLIYNSFTMTVVERTREFGMLRTVGMTRRQVTNQVLLEATLLGILGALLGAGLGVGMARGLTRLMEVMLATSLDQIRVDPVVLATSLAVGFVVTLFAALVPAIQAGRISPLEALRIRGASREGWLIRQGSKIGLALLLVSTAILIYNPFSFDVQFRMGSIVVFTLFFGGTLLIPGTVGLWERLTRPLIRIVYGGSGRLGSRNVQRARVRTTLTVAALMIGVAMILVVRGMTASFSGDLKEWINAYIGGDLYASSSVPMRPEVGRRLESVPGVLAAAPINYLDVKWIKPDGSNETISFMGIDPNIHGRVTNFIFSDKATDPQAALRRLAEGNAVFISSVIAEKNNLREGDTIYLQTGGGVRAFEVAGVVVDFFNQGQVMEGSWADMRRYFHQDRASAYLLKLEPGADPAEVSQRIDDLYGKRYHLTINSNQDLKKRVNTLMDQAFSMFDVLALIALLVGSLGVVNTLTMNVMERTQEIGMLRGVGMTRWQVVTMVLAEALLMGLIGGVLGLGFGVLLSRIFFASMKAMSGYDLTYVMPTQAVVTALVVALLVSQVAAILPARRAARIQILEAIHYE